MKDYESTYQSLHRIYKKYLSMNPENPNSGQMCCMWSTDDPPDVIEDTDPIFEIEEVFDIFIDEDTALELYDLDLADAARKICEMRQMNG
jgi:hypothetical protein